MTASLSWKVNTSALTGNVRKMSVLSDIIDDKLYEATFDSLLDVEAGAKQRAPFRTGNLRRSINHNTERSVQRIVGYVGSNLEYARIQEFGGVAGRNHSVRIQGRHYLGESVEVNKKKISDRFKRYLSVKKLV